MMADDAGELSLLDLFRAEVDAHAVVLNDGLVALESADHPAAAIEPLMRAAHSLKGAARIVGLDTAVRVAHAMEDALVAAQQGRLVLGPTGIDLLLRAVDWLTALATNDEDALPAWLLAHGEEAEQLAQQLSAIDAPGSAPDDAAVHGPGSAPEAGSAPAAEVAPTPGGGPPSATNDAPAAVKVTAEALSRLIGLASESLVEAQRLEPVVAALQDLKAHHTAIAGALERAREALVTLAGGERLGRIVAEAQRPLEDARQLLAARGAELDLLARRSGRIAERLYEHVVSSRMRPFADATAGLGRLVRDVARQLGKQVRLEIGGHGTAVDREILAALEAPLHHVLRNAVDHGIEPPAARRVAGKPEEGRIVLEAGHVAGMLVVRVRDDGGGIDVEDVRRRVLGRGLASAEVLARLSEAEVFEFLLLPGFSTRDAVSEISGRGVGLDVVQSMVQAAGGAVRIASTPGTGTEIELRLPVTRSVLRALLVSIAGDTYAVPLARIARVLAVDPSALRCAEGRQYVDVEGEAIALVSAREVLELTGEDPGGTTLPAVVLGERGGRYAVVVERLLGEANLVVRPLDPRLGSVPDVRAAATLSDGTIALVLDVDDLVRSIEVLIGGGRLRRLPHGKGEPAGSHAKRVLIVEDSLTVRELERRVLEAAGYRVELAVDGMEGWNALRLGTYDLVLTDVDMPRLNGIDLVRRIRADPRLRALPVVIVSYKDRDEDRLRGLDAGADRYLTKSSFQDETLALTVHELIGGADG